MTHNFSAPGDSRWRRLAQCIDTHWHCTFCSPLPSVKYAPPILSPSRLFLLALQSVCISCFAQQQTRLSALLALSLPISCLPRYTEYPPALLLYQTRRLRYLHSFPTRRSSD